MLPALESEYFEVAELPGRQSHHLVGYARFPVSVEMPTIYEWTGTDFVQDNHRYPQFYKKLADERRADLTEPDCVCGEHYCEAVLLNRAGCNSDALAVLKNERWDYVAKSEEPHLIYGCAELMDRLGSRRDALVLALTLRREIYRCKNAARQYNPEEGYYLNYVDPEISYKGALLLEKLGRKKEALTLLKKVREDVADSKIPNLFKEYKRLLSRLEKES